MDRNMSEIKKWRQIYMLDVIHRTKKRRIFYTGQTLDVGVRMYEHIHHINSRFLTRYHYHNRKILVFVDWIYGDENDSCYAEKQIKRLRPEQKRELVKSDRNKLIKYIPNKNIIIRSNKIDIQDCLRLRSRPVWMKQKIEKS